VRREQLTPRRLLLGAALAAATVLLLAWIVPAGDFIYVPNSPKPLADRVEVEGGTPSGPPGEIAFVDVSVREATWLERLVPFARPEGSSLVPRDAILPPGTSFEERREDGRAQMERSESVAAAVALEEAGYEVEAVPRGALVEGVDPGVPAATSLEVGDVIVRAAGRQVRTPAELRAALAALEPGDSVPLRLRRDGKPESVRVTTVEDPTQSGRALIGIRVGQDARIDLPVKVEIDLGDVGGPSAGLPFALEVLEQLGENVDRGRDVVATGEIELDGTIIPVGAIKQKATGVRESGADVFLVPGENAAEARRFAGDVRVIAVDSFQQALRELRTIPAKRS
jgi:PDZ domain-containing protein